MRTTWRVCVLWSVLSLGLLCAAETHESPSARRKGTVLKPASPKSKPVKVSTRRESTQTSAASGSALPRVTWWRRHPPPAAPGTPRSRLPAEPRANIQSDMAYLPDVSVTCSTSDVIVRVKPSFYGLGARAEELTLGSGCKSNGLLRPYDDLLFTYPLTACDAVRQAPRGYLVYKFVLHYEPSSDRFPSRAHRLDVDIECRYQRRHHVFQLAVKPTWQTALVRKRLRGRPSDFKIQLMDDSWSGPAKPQVYQLGQTVNFQVSAPRLPSGGKVYISSCFATPSGGSKSSPKYTIIDNLGCMVDSKRDPGASWFIYRTDRTLQFSLKAFQFTTDPDTELSIQCKLSVTSDDPSPAHKSCTFRGSRWIALTGDDSICECCDSQCLTSKPKRVMMAGFASSELLLVSDQPYTAEDGFLPVASAPVSMSGGDLTTVSQHTEPNRHQHLWESADILKYDGDFIEEELDEVEVKNKSIFGKTTEPDLDERVSHVLVEERTEAEGEDLSESGSGYEIKEDFYASEQEEERSERRGNDTSSQQAISLNQREVLPRRAPLDQLNEGPQREAQPLDSGGEEEKRKYTDKGEEHERTRGSNMEWTNGERDEEMTWYFTWR